MNTFSFMLWMVTFCSDGSGIVKEKCEDHSPSTSVTMSLFGGNGYCDFNNTNECKPDHLIRIEQDGKLIISVPVSVLTLEQLNMLMLAAKPIDRAIK